MQCRPFYLPREITCVALINVYIPPDADVNFAANIIVDHTNKLLTDKPDAAVIIFGDFNKCNLDKTLPKFSQYVTFNTRKESKLDLFYCNFKFAYKCQKLQPIGNSDHNMIRMIPVYKQKAKVTKPVTKSVKCWNNDNIEKLKACYECTNWEVFTESNDSIDDITDAVSSYINFCVDSVIPSKSIKIYGNTKPWFDKELRQKFKEKSVVLKSGDKNKLCIIQNDINETIKACKLKYKQKLEENFKNNNTRQAWISLKQITGYSMKKVPNISVDIDDLNGFYARFDDSRIKRKYPEVGSIEDVTSVYFSPNEVKKQFMSVNPRKASGPDGVSSRVIKLCAEQLSSVFSILFNRAYQEHIPAVWKESCIIPVPKSPTAKEMNDFRPVALTSVPMKCLERLVLKHLKQHTENSLDPYQFAYRSKRGTEDALLTYQDLILQHISQPKCYARVLMIDFSSAFNTVLPDKLVTTLRSVGTPESLCRFVWDFMTERYQHVKLGERRSQSILVNTGSPQGCVMSAYLFSLYTNSCRSTTSNCHILKYADDTAIIALITNPVKDETAYQLQVAETAQWCSEHNLLLNVKKTKELVYDNRCTKSEYSTLKLNINDIVEQVTIFKYLGLTLSTDLSWNYHADAIVAKANKRLFFLRKLKQAGVDVKLLGLFYSSVIQSVLTYCVTVFFNSLRRTERKNIDRVTAIAQKIVGKNIMLDPLSKKYDVRTATKGEQILKDTSHPLNYKFEMLPSGRRLRSAATKSSKYNKTFIPCAITILNSQNVL